MLLLSDANDESESEKWRIGPSATALKQDDDWTYSGIDNHLCVDKAENDMLNDVYAKFLQPLSDYI